MKKLIALAVVIVVLGGTAYYYYQSRVGTQTSYRFAEVKKGHLISTVGSTGTLQPKETVDVGAQVVGRIIFIGKDSNTQSGIVDWGSEVQGPILDKKDGSVIKSGTVLAQIDPDLYEAQVRSCVAALKAAKADLELKKATLAQATADWQRAQTLYDQEPKGVAKAEYDSFKASFGTAGASVDVSAANIGVAEANLKTAQTNLNYATITSPVDGVVIDRRVNVGQTVVASLSAPSLFLIAKDLTKMEVWATVNEVDLGKIRVGQDVKFTVDALPGRTFRGKVVPQGKLPLRLNATMNQNVVTYTVVVSADNSDGMLRPYLTTNLSFVVADKKDVLLAPNAALRWQPAKQQIAPEMRDKYFELRAKKPAAGDSESQGQGFLWVKNDDGFLRYIQVQTGFSDSVNTEITKVESGELPEHTQVIVAEAKNDIQVGAPNPFGPPSPFGGGKKKDQ